MSLFPLHSWKIISLNIKLTVNSYFFQHLKKWSPICLPGLQVRNLLSSQLMSPPVDVLFLSAAFKIFILSLVFPSLTMMCLSTDFLEFTLFVIHLSSWIYRLKSPSKFGCFQLPISLDPKFSATLLFSDLLSFSFPSWTPVRDESFVIVPQASAALFTYSLAHRSWPIFVDDSSNDNVIFRDFEVLFLLVYLVLLGIPLIPANATRGHKGSSLQPGYLMPRGGGKDSPVHGILLIAPPPIQPQVTLDQPQRLLCSHWSSPHPEVSGSFEIRLFCFPSKYS